MPLITRHTLAALFLSLFLPFTAAAAPAAEAAPPAKELWLYYATNLQVGENVDKLEQVWTRAAKAGYTHVLLTDSKLARLDDVIPAYFKNAERAKAIARRLHLTIVPALFDVGYSNNILWHDPNLAEGLPVKDSLFVVKEGRAMLMPDPPVALKKIGFKDENVTLSGAAADVSPGGGGVARFNYRLTLPKFRCYHVSVKIKTDDYRGHPEIKALSGERSLQWQNLGVKPTQDWTEHHVVFNTLDHTDINLYFGDWSHPQKGTLQWKDWKIEEAGLVNVLRRPGAPLIVKVEDGRTLEEGEDFEKVVDPKMGNDPYNGEYRAWHEPPSIKTKLKDGTRLRVSWHHPAVIYDGQVSACVEAPKMRELLAENARRVKDLFGAGAYMMSHDEFRTFGWDASCLKTGQTPGKMLADNARYCRDLLKPAGAYVWSDMFDPYHNAVNGPYYLVNGPWTGSWEGLDKDVVIVNWNYGKRDKSLAFFAERGHRQIIAGYYDGSHDTAKWLAAAKDVAGVSGVMYTTWRGDYSQIEKFAKEAAAAPR